MFREEKSCQRFALSNSGMFVFFEISVWGQFWAMSEAKIRIIELAPERAYVWRRARVFLINRKYSKTSRCLIDSFLLERKQPRRYRAYLNLRDFVWGQMTKTTKKRVGFNDLRSLKVGGVCSTHHGGQPPSTLVRLISIIAKVHI